MDRVDTIERQITLNRPIEHVWAALTEADQLSQWFGDSAEVDLRPGGRMTVGWSEYDAIAECVVESVEPPRRFSYRWQSSTSDDGVAWMTTVEFTLETSGGGTLLTVIESGLSALPDELYGRTLEENSSGWTSELEDLRQMMEGASTR